MKLRIFLLDSIIKIDNIYRKINKKLVLMIFVILMSPVCVFYMVVGCDGYHTRFGDTDFYLGWVNLPITTCIDYEISDDSYVGVTGNPITDCYWNDDYIIATKYSFAKDSIEGYYIIKLCEYPDLKSVFRNVSFTNSSTFDEIMDSLHLDKDEMRHKNLFD
ncbi:MAG: hypothetical protein J5996_01135 [Prevotella sp.]|nr:hypothetical protein [Prevotella sp.]